MLSRPALALACASALTSALVLPAAVAGDLHRTAGIGPVETTAMTAVTAVAAGADGRRDAGADPRTVARTRWVPQLPEVLRTLPPRSQVTSRRIVPGVVATTWGERTRRGPVRFAMVTVRWRAAGVSLDYANAGKVRDAATVPSMIDRDRAVAGINGDFFDRDGTGAPLGLGIDRERGLLHGRTLGWNSTFYVGQDGVPDVGMLSTHVTLRERPDIHVASVNAPEVAPGGVGVYTRAFGRAAGAEVTDGHRRDVRAVVVRDGRVVSSSARLPEGRAIDGVLLVGRGAGARRLATVRRGSRLTVSTSVDKRPLMAITGNTFLLRDGRIRVAENRTLEPRSAIAIDHESRTVMMLVVDGRQPRVSRGYSMLELARKLRALGADDALNLDGGGSSVLVARRPHTAARLVNKPSNGLRAVPSAVEVVYRPR
ncbi:hypothetical protein GCM10023340_16090 [Nocardioides marinquilinus]|uniref:Phosphodiester glycosidase domain-containing protein n=1 Tax=Nocardioides marinquilinus TaxID=1210400 RepID=A0ABP9PFU8_9ACTN